MTGGDRSRPAPAYDVVVVGSGFGGGVTALRLAEAGRRVAVLERGRRYGLGEFPRDPTDVDRLFWRWPARKRSRGLYELRFFSGLATLVASGVGGGSLVYANIHIRPDAEVFDDPRWPGAIRRATLEPYFDRVARVLDLAPVPAALALPKRQSFHDAGKQLGRSVFDPDEAVTWQGSSGPGRTACVRCSECALGCQHGAKNTIDLTYLAQAEALGAELFPGLAVRHVEPVAGGGYAVIWRDVESGQEGRTVGKRCVLAAGTLGTGEILLRSRDRVRSLPKLSGRLGEGYSANGDFMATIQESARDLVPWDGPDVTSVMRFTDERPAFTVAAPAFARPMNAVLASLGQPRLRFLRPLAPLLWPLLGRVVPWLFEKGLFAKPLRFRTRNAGDPSRMTHLFAIGRDDASGRLVLRGDRLDVRWPYARRNRLLVSRMEEALGAIGRAYGGRTAPLATWSAFRRILSVHSLGGCALAESPEKGVASPDGELFGYPGLFVADGSVVPTSLGFHPAMTIAALAERTAERVADRGQH